MQYQSPIRFFEYAGIDYEQVGSGQLSRNKKLVTAEFALQPGGIITLEGISYTKHDVLQLLEDPNLPEIMQGHKLVWRHKSLLDLLERDALDMNGIDSWLQLSNDSNFVGFVSPYFGQAFNSVTKSLLQRNDLYTASVWMDFYSFVLPAEGEEATKALRLYLDETIRLFRNLNAESYKQRMSELKPWIEESWSLLINKLPEQLLHYADELANVIINFTVRIQKKDRKACFLISSELAQLETVNYSLKQLIRNNHAIYQQNYKSGGIRRLLPRIPFAYMAVMALIALLRTCTSSDSNDGYSGASSYELKQDYSRILEKSGFHDMRNYYYRKYGEYKHAGGRGNLEGPLSHAAFSGKDMYLLIESGADSRRDLYPFALKNNTPSDIGVFIMRSGTVYNLEIGAYKVLSLDPLPGANTDLVLTFNPRKELTSGGALDSNNLQYLHIAAEASTPYHAIDFLPEGPVELPFLEEKQLDSLPLLITINRKKEYNYFSVKGKGQVVSFRSLSLAPEAAAH